MGNGFFLRVFTAHSLVNVLCYSPDVTVLQYFTILMTNVAGTVVGPKDLSTTTSQPLALPKKDTWNKGTAILPEALKTLDCLALENPFLASTYYTPPNLQEQQDGERQ